MSKLKLVVHPVKKEFRREKCGFDHAPADDFVKSQWQSCSKSVSFLIYRWFMALFFIAVFIESLVDPDESSNFWLYFIYMTNWGVIMCMLTNILGATLVTAWHYHPEYADKLMNMESLTSPFRIYWGLHVISLVGSLVITIIYWSILYNAAESTLSATNVLTHVFNSICMLLDLLIVAHPMRLLHMFLPVLYGLGYALFSIIYQQLGGINKKGKNYIYHVIDWNQPLNASLTTVGVLALTCFVYMALFTIYKLRTLLYRRLHNATFLLPTTVANAGSKKPTNGDAVNRADSGIQHSPSGISMVLGNYGYHNQAFAKSNENITK